MVEPTGKRKTRKRLIRGLLKTVHAHGLQGLTTGRVTSDAGIAQPTFYVYYRNMEEALAEAAAFVEAGLDAALAPIDVSQDDHPSALMHDVLQRCTHVLADNPVVADVFLQCRRERNTPLGRAWAPLTSRLRERMTTIVYRVRPSIAPPLATVHAEMLVGISFALAEGSIEGRIQDLDQATLVATRAVVASLSTERSAADAA
ncbi:MAG: TetR/AcrR family transcriptional regulator [Myxococcota bacterium]